MALTLEEAAARVAKGVNLLDEKHPGWDKKIDLDKFRMADGCNCVVGQVGGDVDEDDNFWDHLAKLFGRGREGVDASRADARATLTPRAVAHGFHDGRFNEPPSVSDGDYTILEQVWLSVIRSRR